MSGINFKNFKISPLTGGYNEKTTSSPSAVSHYWTMAAPSRVQFQNEVGGLEKLAGHGPAPKLNPITSPDKAGASSPGTDYPKTHINIRDNHHWTESPRSSRREVPMLNLKEMNMLTNPMLNQIANNTFAFAGGTAQAINSAGAAVDSAPGAVVDAVTAGMASLKNLMSSASLIKQEDVQAQVSKSQNVLRGSQVSMQLADPMNPYSFLYTVLDTGFKYTFPFMENNFMSHLNSFGDATTNYSGGSLPSAVLDSVAGLNMMVSKFNLEKMTAPGRLIEEPKAFTFSGREKSYTVKFPLFNTLSYADIVKNWQFLFLLGYQNTPNRINRDMVDPPCIYECYIPGVWYSKYAAITDLTVDFVGARREMPVEIKFMDWYSDGESATVQTKEVMTVIPDAYNVSITVTELFAETQNFKYRMLAESMQSRVTTGTLDVFQNPTRPS